MLILLDMDGVLSDFERSALDTFRSFHPDKPYIPIEERNVFYLKDQYPDDSRPLIEDITNSKGFYGNLPVVEGSKEALLELKALGHELYICTSPKLSNPYCIQEKFNWVKEHLGGEWIGRMIVTRDKTLVRGDILIDDKPEIPNSEKAVWEHILYTRPYNKTVTGKRRLTWENWKEVLL